MLSVVTMGVVIPRTAGFSLGQSRKGNNQGMFAYCKTLLGKTVRVHYDDTTTIAQIRQQIQEAMGGGAVIRLVICGRVHEDTTVYATLRPELMGNGGIIVVVT